MNAAAAKELYLQKYPTRRQPIRRVFVRLHKRLIDHGSLEAGMGPHNHVNVEERILEVFRTEPTISVRKVVGRLRYSTKSVWTTTTINQEKFHSYHYCPILSLNEREFV